MSNQRKLILCMLILPTSLTPATQETLKETPQNFDEIIYNWSRTFAEVFQIANQKHYKVSNAEQCMIKSIDTFLKLH